MKKKLATVMAATMAVSGSVVSVNAATTEDKIVGSNRIDTAVRISKEGWKSAETVILVNDSAIPDALTATPLAHAKNAPILLTGKNGLNKATADEIKRLGAKDVIMIGGDAVLSANVEKDLKALNIKVDRIKGATREETALAIAKRLDGIKDVSEIAVVNGTTGLADAVSVAAAAAEKGMPILLANPKKGLSVAEKFIKDEAIKASFIIGGTTVLPEKLVSSLPGKQRIKGSNRNDTNAKVIEKFYGDRNLDNLYLAKDGMGDSGQLIDALAVGALAAKNGAPVLIASKKLSETQKNVINTKRIDTITQVGGKGNEGAFNQLKDIEKEEVIKVKTEAELQEALKKANANDVIEIESGASISKDLTLSTNNAVEINVKGDLTGEVTVKAPNADIKNSGTIGTLVVEDAKNTTIENTSSGKINKVEVDSSSSNVKVENNGSIKDIVNDSSNSKVENNGTISGSVSGSGNTSIEGNKPGETTKPSTGGGSSSGGSTGGIVTPSGTLELENDVIEVKPGRQVTIKTKGIEDVENISWEINEDEVNGDLIEQETVSNGGEVKLKLKEEIYYDQGDVDSQNFKTAKVIAKYGNQTKECTIKVIPYTQSEVAEIRLDKGKSMEIEAGQSFELVPSLYTKDGIKIYNTSFLGQMGWKVLSDDNSILTNNGVDTNDGYEYKGTINSKAPSGSKVKLEANYGEDVKTEFELTVKNGGSGEIVQGSGITDVRVVSKDTILVYSKHTGLNSDNMAIKENVTNKTMTIRNNWKHDNSDIREIELGEDMNPNSTYILEVTLNGKTETRKIAPVEFVEVSTVEQLKSINDNPENSIILLKAPEYEINEPIVITKPMTIMSDNPEVDASAPIACIKPSSNYDESNGALLKVENVSKGKVIINSLEIDGLNDKANSGKNIIGMDIVGSNVDMIGSVNISNNKLAGINVKSNSNLIVGAHTYNNGDNIKSGIRIDDTATNVNVVLDDADIAEEAEENGYAVCYNGKIDDSKKINITGTITGEGLVEDYYLENERITIWSVYNPNIIL